MMMIAGMKVCIKCGIEKSLGEFYVSGNGRYWFSECKQCNNQRQKDYHIKQRAEILALFGTAGTPVMLKRGREQWARERDRNIKLYGTACTPIELERRRDYHRKRRAGNVELYGTAYSPIEMAKNRKRNTDRRAENVRLFGTAGTPTELRKNRELNARKRAKNVALYRTAVAPMELRMRNERYTKRRMQALTLLGSMCACCGEGRPEVLTFDHIDGGGRRHRVQSDQIVHEILTMDFPASKYRILCWNCNMSLGNYGYCPHNGRPPEEEPVANARRELAKYNRHLNRKHELELIDKYGGECQICGEDNWEFLCIDHINGNGTKHVKSLGIKGGAGFYRWLKKQGYPQDGYQLLCCNCNGAKEKVGKVAERNQSL